MTEEVGFADVETGQRMTETTLVRLYSMTKCIIGAAIFQLVDAGLLGLDDRLRDHLPCFARACLLPEAPDGLPDWGRRERLSRSIRIRHLLTHTSGIACGLSSGLDGPWQRGKRERAWAEVYRDLVRRVDSGEISDLGTWVDELAKLPLQSHPGMDYMYGYGYDVLGRLIEVKSGMSLAAYLREHIFEPLGMDDTGFDLQSIGGQDCGPPPAKRLATLYRCTKSSRFGGDGRMRRLVRVDPLTPGARSRWERCGVPAGGGAVSSLEGGLLSTLRDYSTFLSAVVSGGAHPATGARVLSPVSAARMLQDLTATLGPEVPWSACPYGNPRLGLSCLGEVQRRGLPPTKWFDGVRGVRLWGGAASTAFKFDPNFGRPILVVLMTQVLPQEDGATISALLEGVRELVGPGPRALAAPGAVAARRADVA